MNKIATKSSRAFIDIVIESTSFNVAILMITTLSGILVARYLGPEGRGTLASILAFQSAVITALAWGFPHYYARAAATSSTLQIRTVVSQHAVKTAAITAMMAISLSLATAAFTIPARNAYTYLFLIIWPSTSLLATILIALSQGAADWRTYNLLRTTFPIVNLASLVTWSVFGQLTLEATLLSMIVANIAVLAVAKYYAYPLYSTPTLFITIAEWRDSKQYAYSAYAVFASNQVDILIGAIVLSPSSLGHYAVAKTISSVSSPLFTAISAALFTKTASDNSFPHSTDQLPRLISLSAIHALFILLGSLQFLLFAILPFLTIALFGREYSGAIQVALLLATTFTFLGMANILEDLAKGLGRPELAGAARVAGILIIVLLAFPLAHEFDKFGLALAAGASQLVRCAWIYRSISKLIRDTQPPALDDKRPFEIVSEALLGLMTRVTSRFRNIQ